MSGMETSEQATPKAARLRVAIIVLTVLLVLSAGGLAARYLYLYFAAPPQATATAPDNRIAEETQPAEPQADTPQANAPQTGAAQADGAQADGAQAGTTQDASAGGQAADVLTLFAGRPDANRPFAVQNMLPGDSETRYFCVRAHHDAPLTLFFKADVTEETKKLADVLRIRVTNLTTGEVLCDAPFREIDGRAFSAQLGANAANSTDVCYQIDVYLDTSVGNAYQTARLEADFSWYVENDGALVRPPQTGGRIGLALWAAMGASAALLLLFLQKRRKEARRYA